ncbi:MAG: acyltransferase [Flavobacteriales bacterium]
MLRKIYLSPLGVPISLAMHIIALFNRSFMVYGFFNKVDGKFHKRTRIGSSVVMNDRKKIDIKDNVWIGHYSVLDGIGGIHIGEGVNIASHACIYTHSSHNSIRLLGKKFIETPAEERIGYVIKGVSIGEYSFIGTSSVILPGTKIGKGCVVGAGSMVKGEFPDYSVIVGNPAKVIDDTRKIDDKLFAEGLSRENYYNSVN